MNKIIEGVKEAVKVAQCEHDLEPLHDPRAPYHFRRYYCSKCQGTFYVPKDSAIQQLNETR